MSGGRLTRWFTRKDTPTERVVACLMMPVALTFVAFAMLGADAYIGAKFGYLYTTSTCDPVKHYGCGVEAARAWRAGDRARARAIVGRLEAACRHRSAGACMERIIFMNYTASRFDPESWYRRAVLRLELCDLEPARPCARGLDPFPAWHVPLAWLTCVTVLARRPAWWRAPLVTLGVAAWLFPLALMGAVMALALAAGQPRFALVGLIFLLFWAPHGFYLWREFMHRDVAGEDVVPPP